MGTLVAAGKAPDLHAGRRSGASVRSETLSEKPKENKRELFAGSLNSGEKKKKKDQTSPSNDPDSVLKENHVAAVECTTGPHTSPDNSGVLPVNKCILFWA